MNRTSKYFLIKDMRALAAKQNGCIEFPRFGARYPDATCIDGLLWDLDSCDGDDGGLTSGGDAPCPCCNTKAYVIDLLDYGLSVQEIRSHFAFLLSRYGSLKTT